MGDLDYWAYFLPNPLSFTATIECGRPDRGVGLVVSRLLPRPARRHLFRHGTGHPLPGRQTYSPYS